MYDDYAKLASAGADYQSPLARAHLALGLCGETCDALARAWERQNVGGVFSELGDTQMYVCRLGLAFGFAFGEIVSAGKAVYGDVLKASAPLAVGQCLREMTKVAGALAERVRKYEHDLSHEAKRPVIEDAHERVFVLLVRLVALSIILTDGLRRIDTSSGSFDDCLAQNAAKLRSRPKLVVIRGGVDHC